MAKLENDFHKLLNFNRYYPQISYLTSDIAYQITLLLHGPDYDTTWLSLPWNKRHAFRTSVEKLLIQILTTPPEISFLDCPICGGEIGRKDKTIIYLNGLEFDDIAHKLCAEGDTAWNPDYVTKVDCYTDPYEFLEQLKK